MIARRATRPSSAASGLAADQGGQISAVAGMSAAAFACVLLLVVNTGYATNGKIELQNAADATAISGATWIARGLNVISMNNVTQTQILAIVLVIRALDDALPVAVRTLYVQRIACAALLVGAAACAAIITVQIVALEAIQSAMQSVGRPLARSRGVLWNAMLALEIVSDSVKNSFLVVAQLEADRIARQNGADLGVILPAGLQLTLPVKKGSMRPDLCDPTRRGSPSSNSRGYTPLLGYRLNEGPFDRYSRHLGYAFIPFENSLIRLYFSLARESHYQSLCGGSGSGGPPPEQPVSSLAQCRALGGGTATWVVLEYRTIAFDSPQPGITFRDDNDPRLAGPPRPVNSPQQRSCTWTPPGVSMGNGRYRLTREIVEEQTDAQRKRVRRYRYEFTDYLFLAGSVTSRTPQGGRKPLPSGSASQTNPDPYLLESDAENDLRYLAVVYRSDENRLAPAYFKSPYGAHRLAYAQARVYNPTAFDTFTQDWRVKLEPASLVEDGSLFGRLGSPLLDLAQVRNAGALSRFRDATGLFSELRRSLNLLQYFNNH